ncbi:TIGR02234 family membrane protein [Mycobacterium sp. M1]|uniref:TIGR02234 family membrane protein n=1 Tax=Mycolicibacter acidiphilus TaxID=2835306 RepID=A0ABS5RJ05_9MYCO|nr:TIGR02234 family membrane protein [Mycolicibacter acidiphilus]MBS9534277.1 TIGR02234 family membrane protein [Mycolicibacter acidiphilus]
MGESDGRRALRVAQLLLLAAAGGLWAAARLPWVVIRSSDGLGQPRQVAVTGASWSTALLPLALLCLAAAIAAVAVRGWKLRLLAVLTAVASLAGGYLAVSIWVARDIELRALDIAGVPLTALLSAERRPTGAVLTLVAGVCAIIGAALLMRSASAGAAATAKYAAPGARRSAARGEGAESAGPAAELSERMIWDALDEGCDPTERTSDGAADEGR